MLRGGNAPERVFPASTKWSCRSFHPQEAAFLYTFRHTCITRWVKCMHPFTLQVLAGHTDMNTTKRYVHPSDDDIREAMNRVDGHVSAAVRSYIPTPTETKKSDSAEGAQRHGLSVASSLSRACTLPCGAGHLGRGAGTKMGTLCNSAS